LVLDDQSYRDAARLIAGEIGVMPGPHDVAQTLRERFSGGPVDR
jgi:UDP:flavonoid glycosyltransferase YjiC (YdhE family)